ncbi:uncharacterized protein LOC119448925 isoform X5 [Dermacentor silvarum]|uniref:uncharacterized protein LOC119448925 isoform X5 n=1 Tax=Dermacentor silvarum TaxID=543639 RepID=UPI002100A5D5|nr:uncharacterized protein LOC119448925 isoform X5 [Dermacentor silvarum]
MAPVTVCLCIIVLTSSVSTQHYEDNPQHFARQHARDMIGIRETLYAKSKTASLAIASCFSMARHQQIGNAFLYNVSYIYPQRVLNTFITRLSIITTGQHTTPNAVNFKTTRDGAPTRFKVMYVNPQKTCIILIKDPSCSIRECVLLQTSSTVDRDPPHDCQTVYNHHCSSFHCRVYYHSCKSVLVTKIGHGAFRMMGSPALLSNAGNMMACK